VTGDNNAAQAFRYQALDKTGKTRSATAIPLLRGGGRYGDIHVLAAVCRHDTNRQWHRHGIGSDVIAPVLCEEFTLFRA
jgi:hypothetical protein